MKQHTTACHKQSHTCSGNAGVPPPTPSVYESKTTCPPVKQSSLPQLKSMQRTTEQVDMSTAIGEDRERERGGGEREREREKKARFSQVNETIAPCTPGQIESIRPFFAKSLPWRGGGDVAMNGWGGPVGLSLPRTRKWLGQEFICSWRRYLS